MIMKIPIQVVSFLVFAALIGLVSGKPVGIFTCLHSPEDFTSRFNDTLVVSDTIVAMSEKMYVRNTIQIDAQTVAIPYQITVNNITRSQWNPLDSSFSFSSLFPLSGNSTSFFGSVVYRSNTADTTIGLNWVVITQPSVRMNQMDFEVNYLDRGIVFQSVGGVTLSTITRDNSEIQLRFDFDIGEADYIYTHVSIELFNTNTIVSDREVLTLTKGVGNFYIGKIRRAVATSGFPGNNIFEHFVNNDTLVAVFRNNETPQLLLDTLMARIPFSISPFARIVTAATKDFNGNGYIDAINLTFDSDSSVTGTNPEDGFAVRYGTNTLIVDTVVRTITGNQRQWQLLIKEPEVKDSIPLQTSWTPLVMVNNAFLSHISSQTITAIDSCAPVIFRVYDWVYWTNDRKSDTVGVMFSEKIRSATLTKFSITNAPAQIFRVWWGNTFEPADSLIAGIPDFCRIWGDSVLYFAMSEKKGLPLIIG